MRDTGAFVDTDPACSVTRRQRSAPTKTAGCIILYIREGKPGNPGYLKSEAATYPSEPLP